MATLTEENSWVPGIYQLELIDPVVGGPEGISNLQAKQLANRTLWLKSQVEALGNDKQPIDQTLTSLAALVTAANQMIYSTGPDSFAMTALSAFIRTLLDDADAATARATLGAAPLASPGLTGTPTAPTAASSTKTTQLATTAFVWNAAAALLSGLPMFSAYQSTTQALAQATPTAVKFQTETIDSANAFNGSTGTFTAPDDGLYEFATSVHLNSAGNTSSLSNIDLYVNGVQTRRLQEQVGPVNALCGATGPIFLTAGQTVNIYCHVGGSTANTNAYAALTWFAGRRIA